MSRSLDHTLYFAIRELANMVDEVLVLLMVHEYNTRLFNRLADELEGVVVKRTDRLLSLIIGNRIAKHISKQDVIRVMNELRFATYDNSTVELLERLAQALEQELLRERP